MTLPVGASQPYQGLNGRKIDPFASPAAARVFVFVRTDCPLTNRYAPELNRIVQHFSSSSVVFWLVYPGARENEEDIKAQVRDFRLPGVPLRDPQQELVKRARATTAPEAAVFDAQNRLRYHGRIDDRWVAFGKSRPEAQKHDLEDAIAALLHGKPIAEAETHAIGCSLADLQ